MTHPVPDCIPQDVFPQIYSFLPFTDLFWHQSVSKRHGAILQQILELYYDDRMNRQLFQIDNQKKISQQTLLDSIEKRFIQNYCDLHSIWNFPFPFNQLVHQYYQIKYLQNHGLNSREVTEKVMEILCVLGWPASRWRVHRSVEMSLLFYGCNDFNEDIANWDVSKVVSMRFMFSFCRFFNQDLSRWNTGKLQHMGGMFSYAYSFNSPLFQNVAKVKFFNATFMRCLSFNQDISCWDTSNAKNTDHMFHGAANFNQDISNWNTTNVCNMDHMFEEATAFDCDLYKWNTYQNLISAKSMFKNARSFNGVLFNKKDKKNQGFFLSQFLKNCSGMFEGCKSFNQKVVGGLSKVEDVSRMFYGAEKFNQDLALHSTCCKSFSKMFYNAYAFGGRITHTKELTFINRQADMSFMFYNARSFNQDISHWEVNTYNDTKFMFAGATEFNQNLNSWMLEEYCDYRLGMFLNCKSLNMPTYCWKFKVTCNDDYYKFFAGAQKMLARLSYENTTAEKAQINTDYPKNDKEEMSEDKEEEEVDDDTEEEEDDGDEDYIFSGNDSDESMDLA